MLKASSRLQLSYLKDKFKVYFKASSKTMFKDMARLCQGYFAGDFKAVLKHC